MKNIFLTLIAIIGIITSVFAQIPPNVPTSGLIGYYPFNNSGNDIISSSIPSVNSAISCNDRFANVSSAYQFNGANIIKFMGGNPLSAIGNSYQNYTFNFWVNATNTSTGMILGSFGWGYYISFINNKIGINIINTSLTWTACNSSSNVSANNWHMITITKSGTTVSIYIDNVLDNTISSVPNIAAYGMYNSWFGANGQDNTGYLNGILDDIGIWNRALTPLEISQLYQQCGQVFLSQPISITTNFNSNATFNGISGYSGAVYEWQTNTNNLGWLNLPINNTYAGSNTNTLTVNNLQLSNHLQHFRLIATSGNCADTSNIVQVELTDTCINTIYDTVFVYTSVTDTLIINAALTGLNPPNNINNIKIFPNPASSYITIDYGNFVLMNGYILKITNSQAQVVFVTAINQQSSYIDLSSWSGNGIYFVQIIDTQNNVIENRKIVLQ